MPKCVSKPQKKKGRKKALVLDTSTNGRTINARLGGFLGHVTDHMITPNGDLYLSMFSPAQARAIQEHVAALPEWAHWYQEASHTISLSVVNKVAWAIAHAFPRSGEATAYREGAGRMYDGVHFGLRGQDCAATRAALDAAQYAKMRANWQRLRRDAFGVLRMAPWWCKAWRTVGERAAVVRLLVVVFTLGFREALAAESGGAFEAREGMPGFLGEDAFLTKDLTDNGAADGEHLGPRDLLVGALGDDDAGDAVDDVDGDSEEQHEEDDEEEGEDDGEEDDEEEGEHDDEVDVDVDSEEQHEEDDGEASEEDDGEDYGEDAASQDDDEPSLDT